MAHGPGDHLRKLTGNPGFPEGQPCSDTSRRIWRYVQFWG